MRSFVLRDAGSALVLVLICTDVAWQFWVMLLRDFPAHLEGEIGSWNRKSNKGQRHSSLCRTVIGSVILILGWFRWAGTAGSRGLRLNLLPSAGSAVRSGNVGYGFIFRVLRKLKSRDCTACLGDLFQWSAVLTVQNAFLYPAGTCLVLIPVRCLLDHVLLFHCAVHCDFCFFLWKSKELQYCVLFVCSVFVEVCVQS